MLILRLLLLLVPFWLTAQTGSQTGNPAGGQNPAPAATPGIQQPSAPQTGAQAEDSKEQVRDDAEEGIKHMLVSQIEAWNRGQLEGFMQGYWRSPDLTFFSSGTVTKGWEPTLLRYRQRYKSQGKEMGQLEFQDLNIDLLSRRAAVVTGKWHLTMSDGKQPHGLFTLIVKKMPGGWKIVHDHTSAEE
jgi:beta-aspartyl-peptidase (threonine type)